MKLVRIGKLIFRGRKYTLIVVLCLALLSLTVVSVYAETSYNTVFFDVSPMPRTAECLQCHAGGGPNSSKHSIITMAQNTLANAVNIPGSGWFLTDTSLNSDPATIHSSHATGRWSGTWCISCHRTPNCTDCHTTVNHNSHGTLSSQQANCVSCHQGLPNVVKANPDGTSLCINCHSSSAGSQGEHKATSDLPVTCSSCHDGVKAKGSFNTHGQEFVDIRGNAIHPTCSTCHASTNPTVKDFVYANLGEATAVYKCDACHNAHIDQEVKHQDTLDASCMNCHADNVSNEHTLHPKRPTGNSVDCDTCHQSSKTEVKRSIAANTLNCGSCHKTGHNVGLVDKMPELPLYPGYTWTSPIEAGIFKGDSYYPAGNYENGQVILSNRQKGVSVSQVWDFYNRELIADGWKLVNRYDYPTAGTGFIGQYVYGQQVGAVEPQLEIHYYTTEDEGVPGPIIDGKTKIWYAY